MRAGPGCGWGVPGGLRRCRSAAQLLGVLGAVLSRPGCCAAGLSPIYLRARGAGRTRTRLSAQAQRGKWPNLRTISQRRGGPGCGPRPQPGPSSERSKAGSVDGTLLPPPSTLPASFSSRIRAPHTPGSSPRVSTSRAHFLPTPRSGRSAARPPLPHTSPPPSPPFPRTPGRRQSERRGDFRAAGGWEESFPSQRGPAGQLR